jgi:hypothetical protein
VLRAQVSILIQQEEAQEMVKTNILIARKLTSLSTNTSDQTATKIMRVTIQQCMSDHIMMDTDITFTMTHTGTMSSQFTQEILQILKLDGS